MNETVTGAHARTRALRQLVCCPRWLRGVHGSETLGRGGSASRRDRRGHHQLLRTAPLPTATQEFSTPCSRARLTSGNRNRGSGGCIRSCPFSVPVSCGQRPTAPPALLGPARRGGSSARGAAANPEARSQDHRPTSNICRHRGRRLGTAGPRKSAPQTPAWFKTERHCVAHGKWTRISSVVSYVPGSVAGSPPGGAHPTADTELEGTQTPWGALRGPATSVPPAGIP